jgi:hypothetical protein
VHPISLDFTHWFQPFSDASSSDRCRSARCNIESVRSRGSGFAELTALRSRWGGDKPAGRIPEKFAASARNSHNREQTLGTRHRAHGFHSDGITRREALLCAKIPGHGVSARPRRCGKRRGRVAFWRQRHHRVLRFGGNGIIGYFKIRSIPDCRGAVDLTIRVQPMPSTPTPPAR